MCVCGGDNEDDDWERRGGGGGNEDEGWGRGLGDGGEKRTKRKALTA